MTHKELVDMLVENYAADDEVYVCYYDDKGECVEVEGMVKDIAQTFCF